MHLDSNGLVILDQDGFPGNVGDSAAETSRMVTLQVLLGQVPTSNLNMFMTPTGVVRYPIISALGTLPNSWTQSDTSGDQVSPLIAASSVTNEALAYQVVSQVVNAGYRTGNGTLINPGLLANMQRSQGSWLCQIWDLALLGQALIFLLPFAWNPSATLNPTTWFVSSAGQSADYLNWINSLAFANIRGSTAACWLATKLISSSKALAQVQSYYAVEPNNSVLLNLYTQAIAKIW